MISYYSRRYKMREPKRLIAYRRIGLLGFDCGALAGVARAPRPTVMRAPMMDYIRWRAIAPGDSRRYCAARVATYAADDLFRRYRQRKQLGRFRLYGGKSERRVVGHRASLRS